MDWVLLSVGGFLLGSFLYTGYYTTRYETHVRYGYAIVGIGIFIAVAANLALSLKYDGIHSVFRIVSMLAWAIIAVGLIVIVRHRRHASKERSA